MINTSMEENQTGLLITVACQTDKGKTREINEDAYVVCDLGDPTINVTKRLINHRIGKGGLLLAVADGMGGAMAGEVASQLAIEQLIRRLSSPSQEQELSKRLSEGLKSANLAVRRAAQDNLSRAGMGAAMTAALIHDGHVVLGQVGDSRGYLIRGDEVRQLTRDQSLVQVLIDIGQLTEDEAKGSPERHVILQAIGVHDELKPSLSAITLAIGDHLMLCSDYLMQKVTAAEVFGTVRVAESLGDACQHLVALANERGGEDNITVLIARFDSQTFQEPQGIMDLTEQPGPLA
jgi:serine/threonine protein phosphatase PrpC